MDTQVGLEKLISHLEDERKALHWTSVILGRKRDNVNRYLETLAAAPVNNNTPKRRAQTVLRPIKEHSIDLFVLCALATNQRVLGGIKWSRDEIDAIIQWWEREEQPIAQLRTVWNNLEGNLRTIPSDKISPIPQTMNSSDGMLTSSPSNDSRVSIKAAQLIDALRGKETLTLIVNQGIDQVTNVELPDIVVTNIFDAYETRTGSE